MKNKIRVWSVVLVAVLCGSALATTYTVMNYVSLRNSIINSTTVGITTPALVNSTGYQYNGAAPSNHTLCGNGTSYVDCNSLAVTVSSNLTGSRALGTTYQNTTVYPMMVNVVAYFTAGYGDSTQITCEIGSTSGALTKVFTGGAYNQGGQFAAMCRVPPGWYYQVFYDPSNVSVNIQPPTGLVSWIEETN